MKKLLNYLFIACAALALLLAFGYVAVEMAAVITGNGSLTTGGKPPGSACLHHVLPDSHRILYHELRIPLDLRRLNFHYPKCR